MVGGGRGQGHESNRLSTCVNDSRLTVARRLCVIKSFDLV